MQEWSSTTVESANIIVIKKMADWDLEAILYTNIEDALSNGWRLERIDASPNVILTSNSVPNNDEYHAFPYIDSVILVPNYFFRTHN
jgi:hypothetical protein